MSQTRARLQRAIAPARDILIAHAKTVLPGTVTVAVGVLILLVLTLLYAQLIGVTAYRDIVAGIDSIDAWTSAAALVMAPLAVLAVIATLVWAGTVTQAAGSSYDKRRLGMPGAAWRSLRRLPKALALILIYLFTVVITIIASPVLLVLAIVRLIRKKPQRAPRIVRWSLSLPAAWIDGLSIRGSLRESAERATLAKAVTVLAALVVSAGITEGAAALAGDPGIQFAIRVVALLVLSPLPFVALAVLYRRGTKAKPATESRAMSRKAQLAAALTASLILPLIVGVGPAQAAGTTITFYQGNTASLTGQDFVLTAAVNGTAPTGQLTFEALPATGPAIVFGPYTLDVNSQVVEAVGSALPAGDYQLTAHYAGDAQNPATVSTALAHSVSVPTADLTVTSVPDVPDTATLTITLSARAPAAGIPTGAVTVNGTPVAMNGSGVGTLVVDVAAAPSRELTISYAGDSTFAPVTTLYSVPRVATKLTVAGAVDRTTTYGDAQTYEGDVRGVAVGATTPSGTVQLIWKNNVVASGTLTPSGGFSITTTALDAGSGDVVLEYLGDANHSPSDNRASPITLSVAKANATPVITYVAAALGDSGSLTATLPATATGTVQFTTAAGDLITAPLTLVGGAVTVGWVPVGLRTSVVATYSGDHNHVGIPSAALPIDVDRAAVDVTVTDPGAIVVGNFFTLNVTVKVGMTGVRATHGVDFVTADGTVLASNVYVDATGHAGQGFCARTSCPPPGNDVPLGTADLDIYVRYSESSVNYAGQALFEYRPSFAVTTTDLTVTPNPIPYGSGVNLTATVSSATTTPTGTVTFSAVNPDGSLVIIKNVALTGGVAQWTTQSGDSGADLVWPMNGIKAVYNANGAPYQGSSDDVAITLGRMATSLTVTPVTPVLGVSTPVVVTIDHAPGVSADFRGSVTMTSDDGSTCTAYVSPGAHATTCYFTWTATGSHTVTAEYSGDIVYEPAGPTTLNLSVGTVIQTPHLGLTAPSAAIVGDDVTVTWTSDPTMTGTATVYGDGVVWCTVAVTANSCTGRFGIGSSGSTPIRLVWAGDAGWYGADVSTNIVVTRCVQLDVRSNDTSLGTVRVDTAPNCGASGYLPGTSVQVTAVAKSPGEFAQWVGYRPPAPNLVLVASTPTTTFTPTTDTQTWVRVAQFRLPCNPVTAFASGYGGISVYPAPNCPGGYLPGTKVVIYPDGHYNPAYDEPDGFWSFSRLPAGAVQATDSAGRPFVRMTVDEPTTIRVSFGPVCRTVGVRFEPASPGDGATFDPPHNCSSSTGGGYLRWTDVTVHAVPGDPSMAITGWTFNGVAMPDFGTSNDVTVEADVVAPELVATVVHCYSVDVKLDAVRDRNGMSTGDVKIDGTACPDGSDRYLGGTKVTLTPQVLAVGTLFNGWDEQRIKPVGPASGAKGDVSEAARTLVLDRDIQTTAGFFDRTACSSLINAGSPGLLTFDDSGCGPGYYYDARKQQANAEGVDPETLVGDKWLSSLRIDVHQKTPLPVYVSIDSDPASCANGITPDSTGFSFLGAKKGAFDCKVAGPVMVDASVCQPVVTVPTFTVGTQTYGPESMPGTFYVTGPDGVVRPVSGFEFGSALPVTALPNGGYKVAQVVSGTCAAKPNLFVPNTTVLLYAAAPGSGFRFDGWTGFGTVVKQSPLPRTTNADNAALKTNASFTVTCQHVTFGEGMHIEGDAPRCPGTSEADGMFIKGTSIMVRADYQIGDRTLQKFTKGVAGNQVYEDPATLDLVGFAYVSGDISVEGLYQDRSDRINTEIIKGLKFGTGIIAVVGPVMLGMIFPPAGIYFGLLGAAAGIIGAIPGGKDVAAVFDLINPTKITSCIARWGFTNPGGPGTQNVGAILSTAKTAATAVFTNTDVLVQNIGLAGVAGSSLAIGYGLYDAGIGGANLTGPQSVEELAGTSTIAGCMDDVWSAAGTNLSGNGAEDKAP